MADDPRFAAHIVSALNLIASYCVFEGEGAVIVITPTGHTLISAGEARRRERHAALGAALMHYVRTRGTQGAPEARAALLEAIDSVKGDDHAG